jgi:hypothetical protein
VSAAEADAARASAATGAKSTNLRRKAYRLATLSAIPAKPARLLVGTDESAALGSAGGWEVRG